MKKITHNKGKRVAILAIIAFMLSVIPSVASAYGPERKTFTMEKPADYVTFNSITDNPVLGDERNFVRIAEADSESIYGDDIKLVPGKTYELYIGYHNNAKSSLNQSGAGIARGATVSVQYPTTVTPSEPGKISAIISAVNADPTEVWDSVDISSDTPITLNYVVASAKIYNSWGSNGSTLSTAIFSEQGTYIGLNQLNGLLPGCAEYSGHILIKFRANDTSAKVEKTVSKDGVNFSKEIEARPGDELTYKVQFTNTGTTDLTNVTFHDELPEGLVLIEGTTTLQYSTEDTAKQMSDLITTNGYNTGLYGPGTGATLIYKVKVTKDQDFCGDLINKFFVDHDNGEITDGAVVKVKGDDCKTPEYNCETDPTLPECQKPDCVTNPEMEGCQELPNTGPVEVILAIVIVLGIAGGGYYLYRTKKTLKTAEKVVKGEDTKGLESTPEMPSEKTEEPKEAKK